MIGAAGPTRTDDLTLTKRLLYQLSYSGVLRSTAMGTPGEREFYQNASARPRCETMRVRLPTVWLS